MMQKSERIRVLSAILASLLLRISLVIKLQILTLKKDPLPAPKTELM